MKHMKYPKGQNRVMKRVTLFPFRELKSNLKSNQQNPWNKWNKVKLMKPIE